MVVGYSKMFKGGEAVSMVERIMGEVDTDR